MSQYKTGTVSVTNNSNAVVGTGTSWVGKVAAGNLFTVSGSFVPYIVAAVANDTNLTLSANYGGATQAGLAYSITTSLTPNRSLPYMEDRDVDTATIFKRAMTQLDTILGAVFTADKVVRTDANGNLTTAIGSGAFTTLSASGLITANAGISVPTGFNVTGAGTAQVTGFATIDSGAAADLLLKRNGVTQLTLGSLSATFAGTLTAAGLTSTGVVNVNSAGIDSNQASFGAFGTPATLTIGSGASAALNLGHASGLVTISGGIKVPSVGTTATAANAFIDNADGNRVLRSTSSLRYKGVLGDVQLAAAKKIVMGSRAVRFESLAPADYAGEEHLGFVAEQIAEIDDRLVTRDVRGRPDWVQYPLYVVPLAVLAADHERRLAALEARSRK